MQIIDLAHQPSQVREQAAALLTDAFKHPNGWPTLQLAHEEIVSILRDGFALAMVDGGTVLGWVGGLPEYRGRVWELHPIVVRREYRLRGIGRSLVDAFEEEALERGALTATVGTDDELGLTSMAHVDLYDDIPGHIAGLKDLGRGHPFLFYLKVGYVVTGVMPDANGRGRPDIYLSKALQAEAPRP